ncbi:MAG TPA: hypothetical protein PKD45_15495 [Flavobacteriales bacterium]|nr:hypothetical protein [Flavobacteriales bacterium]
MEQEQQPHTPDRFYLEQLKAYQASSRQREEYAKGRLDLLTITISGAGLYICLETLRFLQGDPAAMPAWPAKLAGVLFTLAMAINFLGQHAGARTNHAAAELGRLLANAEHYGTPDQPAIDRSTARRERYNRLVHRANRAATALLLAGVACLMALYAICL